MVATLAIEFVELTYQRAVLALPDTMAYHNHIGGPHAGALFTLGESASGALVLANFGDLLGEVTPLAVEATIAYRKIAMGVVRATAIFATSVTEVLATLAVGERPEFDVLVEFATGEGTQRLITADMKVRWTLRPTRR